MSDNSISTNSASSSSSWTVLTPESNAAAVENVGPGDDGSGSLADTSSLSEDAAGSLTDSGASSRDAPANGLRSEEGLQVCQETVAESGHSFTPPSPTLLSPSPTSHVPLLSNLESYSLASADLDSNTGISLQAGGQTPLGPTVNTNPEAYTDICPPESHIPVGPYPESSITVPAPMREEEGGRPQEQSELAKKVAEVGKQAVQLLDHLVTDFFLFWGRRLARLQVSDSPYDSELGEVRGAEGDRLRKRKVRPLGPLDKTEKQADEDEDEEEEYRPIQQVEEHGGFSLNKCILGALILLGLGTILFSDDDVEVRELKDPEVPLSQDWVNRDMEAMRVQEMAQLLDKLAQENQQIAVLQAQLQSQAEELNLALQRAEEGGKEFVRKEELEKENEQMRMELSSLPSLQRELETLRARVTELAQITASKDSTQFPSSAPVSPSSDQNENSSQSTGVEKAASMEGEDHQRDRLTEELERQKVLLQESRKRLEEMKVENGGKKGVREGLVEVERRLTEEVEKLGQRREAKRKERHGGRKWEGQGDRDVMKKWGRQERKEWKEGKDAKRGDDAWGSDGKEWQERKEWRDGKDWKLDRDGRRDTERQLEDTGERREWKGEKDWKKGRDDRDNRNEWKEKESKNSRGEKEWKHQGNGERDRAWKQQNDIKEWEEKRKEWSKGGDRRRDNGKEEMKHGEWKINEVYHRDEEQSKDGSSHESHVGERSNKEFKEEGKKERHWKSTADKKPLDAAHRHHEHNDYWKGKKQKLQHYYRAPVNCSDIAACAKQEGLVPVQLADFEGLLASYLEKLGEAESKSKEEIGTLVRDFFVDGVFSHDRISFRDFVEDLADILEDIVEAGGNEELEDEMEEFEREALRKFVLDGGEEKRGDWKRGNGRVRA
ncbi:pre-B-cell leukemia transcription factor-interacting protein 1-like isoform X2 [Scleropages formosus]|uniref:pre-B-cell leukemia transcription factor-interacting protein 1-like isoform X2 n=1 Tax=Scleropages formosus TaxID=113540 RepID=UPI0010FAB3FA|nr:pre-B-cell leukemia transcription factor-interacting protein 1 isoform X2 [Scleropages formosus]